MDRLKQIPRKFLILGLLGAVTLVLFGPVWRHDFIRYDDPDYVLANPHVSSGLTWANIEWALGSGYASNWHPVTWISHMLDVQWFGLKPGGHHGTNVVLHVVNTCLLFLLLRKLTGREWRSALVAALFAWHPLHVESVAWIAERKDVLSAFFFLLTLGAYARYANAPPIPLRGVVSSLGRPQGQGARWYLAAWLCLALGLMSKPMLVTTPFVLLLLDLWPLGRLPDLASLRRRVLEKMPFFCLAIASSVVTLLVQEKGHAVTLVLPFSSRLANAIAAYVRYLGKTVWPLDLAVFYPHPDARYPVSHQWAWGWIVAAGLGLAAMSVWAASRWRRAPWFVTGWFWFLGTLVPVIGLVQAGSQAMADRYTYLPLIGIFISAVWAVGELWNKRTPTVAPGVLGAGVLTLCLAFTHRQLAFWQNNLTLFEHALAVTQDNAIARCHVGMDYGGRGQYQAALYHFQAAIEADPALADAHYGLGYTLQLLGKNEPAAQEYHTTLRLRPWHPLAHSRLAELSYAQGRVDEALDFFAQALRVNPGNAEARINLAGILWQQGKRQQALAHYAEAVRFNPGNPVAHFNYGVGLAGQGRPGEAAAHFAEAVKLQPDYPEALSAWGRALMQLGKLDEACQHLSESLRLRPEAPTCYTLALARSAQGRVTEAVTAFNEALRLKPDWVPALNELAWLRATHPQAQWRNGAEAVRLAERACQLSGAKEPQLLATLDAAYAEAGRFEDAIKTAEKARDLAQAAGQTNLVQAAETRILLYRKGQAVRR